MILLDTDHFSLLRYPESEKGRRLQERLTLTEIPSITIVTVEEQMRGWLGLISRERFVRRQVLAYRELAHHLEWCTGFDIIPFDDEAAGKFDQLRSQKIRVPTFDLKIASIALVNDAMLLTANLRDFQRVPGLRVENWLDSD